jgi:hypothetical protein
MEKEQKDKQWSTKHYTENKRFAKTNYTKKNESELGSSGEISSSCSTSGVRRVTTLMISHELDWEYHRGNKKP